MTDDLEERVGRIEDMSSQRIRQDQMARLAPARLGDAGMPPEPTVGASPFDVATLIAAGVVDWPALAPGLIAAPTIALGTAAAVGVAQTLIRSDATIAAFDATAPTTSAVGDAAAVGAAAFAARRDHRHGRESFGASAAAVGTSSGGAATTPSRSDHVHATGAGVPSTQAFGDAAAIGAGPAAAMTDHKHAMMADPVTAHEAAGDPHTGYQKESEKGAASGYASLDAGTLIPTAQHGSGTADATSFLRGDRTWAAPTASQVSRDATAAAADYVARIRLGTDTTYRAFLGLDASDRGALEFGPGGAAARDTNLYRSAADTLKTDDELHVTRFLRVLESAVADEGGELILDGQGANADWSIDNFAGRLRWYIGGTVYMDLSTARLLVAGGDKIALGSAEDVVLRRDGANSALFDATRVTSQRPTTAGAAFQARVTGDTDETRFVIRADGKHEWGSGTASDTNLYRSAADTLKTDDSFNVGANVNIVPDGRIALTERTDPGTSVANTLEIYARDNGAGKTQLMVQFPTGSPIVLATQP